MKPVLEVNGRQASLDLLKNTTVTLTTINYTDAIPVTKIFENVKFDNRKEYILDFQVPPYLNNISVEIKSTVNNITT